MTVAVNLTKSVLLMIPIKDADSISGHKYGFQRQLTYRFLYVFFALSDAGVQITTS